MFVGLYSGGAFLMGLGEVLPERGRNMLGG